ncbi:MAG: Gfo/Idh/MocA family protein, partial [Planctomycetota bacterium]
IDKAANDAIMAEIAARPDQFVRCSSEFPYFPGAQRLVQWIQERKFGRIMEVRAGFHHASDMNLEKPINWKRMIDKNGEYGCMGDLGMHTQHIPFRMGWKVNNVYASLLNIATTRPDGKGNTVPCETWDNATLVCGCEDPVNGEPFQMMLETKRMAPGCTNTWFIEVVGTEGSAKFSTHDPKAFDVLETAGSEQGWTRYDVGAQSCMPSITGGIFEFGFSDAFQQMIGAFMAELSGRTDHPFPTVTPEETAMSHALLTAALESHKTGTRINL